MRIIGILCGFLAAAYLSAVSAQAASSTERVSPFINNTLPPLIDMNQNQAFGSEPRTPRLFLQAPGSVKSFPKLAKVHFIIDDGNKVGFDVPGNQEFEFRDLCKVSGYTRNTPCGNNEYIGQVCPYDNSYFDRCCDKNYAYNRGECSYPNTLSGDTCNGKYKCYCDRSLYPYTSCPTPKITTSDKCNEKWYTNGAASTTTYYSGCVCPSNYNSCGTNQVGNGAACPEDGTTKYASCSCASGYNLTCSDYGPVNANDYCLLGIKYYRSCKTAADVCKAELEPRYPGYTMTQNCGAYETVLATCSRDSSYKICQPTCKSQMAANSSFAIDSNGFIYNRSSPSTAYVVESTSTTPVTNTNTGSTYTNVYGPSSLSYYSSQCGSLPKPTITLRATQNSYVLSRSFSGVNLNFNDSTYYLNSNASFYDVGFSGASSITLNASGSSARITMNSAIASGRNWNLYLTNGAYASIDANVNLSILSVRSGSSAYVGGGGSNNITYLDVDGSGSKVNLAYSGYLYISSATVSNKGVLQAEDSGGHSYQIGTLTVSNYGMFKTNYVRPFYISNLYLNDRGIAKVGSSGQIRVSGNIYIRYCARMCTYSGSNEYNVGYFYYRNSYANCFAGSYGAAVYYAEGYDSDFYPMNEDAFNYSACYTKKYLGGRWLVKDDGQRGKEMCGSSYSTETISYDPCTI